MHKFTTRRARRSTRTGITLLAAVGIIGATAAIAPAMAPGHTSIRIRPAADAATTYDGTVNNNGNGATVYDYPGGGTALDTSLPATGSLADGTQVSIQCYLTGTSVAGPERPGQRRHRRLLGPDHRGQRGFGRRGTRWPCRCRPGRLHPDQHAGRPAGPRLRFGLQPGESPGGRLRRAKFPGDSPGGGRLRR
jgi:hypothetical protein